MEIYGDTVYIFNNSTCVLLVVAQLLLSEENDKERPDNVEDDEDGHLIYNINDVIRKQCMLNIVFMRLFIAVQLFHFHFALIF